MPAAAIIITTARVMMPASPVAGAAAVRACLT